MSKTIQIPVHMPLTLPDNWQDCTTAQQLAYWILADFEEFKAGQATKEEIAELSNAINQLSAVVGTKTDKITVAPNTGTALYAVSSDGSTDTQTKMYIDNSASVNGIIPVRLATGDIEVPDTPISTNSATSQKYVDKEVKEVSDACHANTVAIGNINTTISGINGNITEIKADVGGLQTDVGGLQTDVGGLQTNVGGLQTNVGELQADVGALQADVTQLQNTAAEWINNPSNVVTSSALFQTVTAVNNKVTVSDSLFTAAGYTMFVMVKGITADITNGKVFEKTGAIVNYDSNVREIDAVSATQNPVFLINCFTYSGSKILNVSTLSAFV